MTINMFWGPGQAVPHQHADYFELGTANAGTLRPFSDCLKAGNSSLT